MVPSPRSTCGAQLKGGRTGLGIVSVLVKCVEGDARACVNDTGSK